MLLALLAQATEAQPSWNPQVVAGIIGAIAVIVASFVAGRFAYTNLSRRLADLQRQELVSHRNELLRVVVENDKLRHDLSLFISSVYDKDYKEVRERMQFDGLRLLLLVKPELERGLTRAVDHAERTGQDWDLRVQIKKLLT